MEEGGGGGVINEIEKEHDEVGKAPKGGGDEPCVGSSSTWSFPSGMTWQPVLGEAHVVGRFDPIHARWLPTLVEEVIKSSGN